MKRGREARGGLGGPRRPRGRWRRRGPLARISTAALLLGTAVAAYALARFLLGLALPPAFGSRSIAPGELLASALSMLLFGLAMGLVGSLAVRYRPNDPFSQYTEAFRRIARGDFDVAVPAEEEEGHPMAKFAGEVNEMARSLKRMEELRQDFVATLSHDIQSPLTSIIGFAKASREEGLDAATKAHYLDIIEAESARLSRLARDLLALTALDARTPEKRRYSLSSQVEEAALALEPQWSAKAIDLHSDLESLEVLADRDMLSEALNNLIGNAVKFSQQGGIVELGLAREGASAVFRVADRGVGIALEDLPYVFDRFFKADKSRSQARGDSGSGLGLAIVKRIVELHGGTVGAESAGLGEGSTFTLRLPIGL